MSKIDRDDIIKEIIIFVRNQLTDSQGRQTAQVDLFSGTGSTTTFSLSNSGATNVSTVTIGGTAKTFGNDYTVSYGDSSSTTTTINFGTSPASGTNNISITYYHGTNWVYDDKPKESLSIGSFPRVAVYEVSETSKPIGVGDLANQSELLIGIKAVDTTSPKVRDMLDGIKDAIIDNMKNFYYFDEIHYMGRNGIMVFGGGSNEVVQQTMTLRIPLLYET